MLLLSPRVSRRGTKAQSNQKNHCHLYFHQHVFHDRRVHHDLQGAIITPAAVEPESFEKSPSKTTNNKIHRPSVSCQFSQDLTRSRVNYLGDSIVPKVSHVEVHVTRSPVLLLHGMAATFIAPVSILLLLLGRRSLTQAAVRVVPPENENDHSQHIRNHQARAKGRPMTAADPNMDLSFLRRDAYLQTT